jgi:polyketide cyclase/dehydrase/lipid transport protein
VGQQVIHQEATTTAGPATVYELLADGTTWPEWSPIGSFELLEPGDASPEGLGAVRRFTTGRIHSTERVVERRPGEQFSYVLVSGLPLRDYRADVTLTPGPDGTTITWHSAFEPKVPGTGGLYRRQLGKFIARCVEGLARASERAPLR